MSVQSALAKEFSMSRQSGGNCNTKSDITQINHLTEDVIMIIIHRSTGVDNITEIFDQDMSCG
jgi:hypothetical protein